MAEIWVAGIATVAVGAYSADQASDAGKDAARGEERASAAGIAEDRRQYDLNRQDQMPFLEHGYDALRRQQAALNGDFSQFQASPDYAFTRDASLQALDRNAAARGGFTGGGADADRMQLANGLASQHFGNYWGRLAGMAGQGQGSAQNLGAMGMQMAGNVGDRMMDAANARASSYANSANAWSNFGQQAVGAFGSWMGNRGGSGGGGISPVQRQPLQTWSY